MLITIIGALCSFRKGFERFWFMKELETMTKKMKVISQRFTEVFLIFLVYPCEIIYKLNKTETAFPPKPTAFTNTLRMVFLSACFSANGTLTN